MQIMEGNLLATIEKYLPWIGHFHAAGVPGRGELFGCELNYPVILAKIEALGYQGAFGLEYFPKLADHGQSLRQTCWPILSRKLVRIYGGAAGRTIMPTMSSGRTRCVRTTVMRTRQLAILQ